MSFVDLLFTFSVAMFFFLVIDLTWLGYIARDFYKKQLKRKMRKDPNWHAAILFYILFVLGLMYFAIVPAINDEAFARGVLDAAIYGFITYMTYELTNYAVINGWPKGLIVLDIVWGVTLSTAVMTLTYVSFFII